MTSEQFGGSGQTALRIDFGYTNRDELSSKTWFTDLAGSTVLATSAYAYDDGGHVTAITNKNASAVTLSYYNYTRDDAHRVMAHTWWSQIGTVAYSGTKTYTYDAAYQLTHDSTTAYSYDLAGNRTMTGYQTGTANRLTNDGTFTNTYDAQGNLTQQSKGASLETWYYAYDHRNHQTSVRQTSDGSTNLVWVTYTYDVEGRRVKEEEWLSTGGGAGETRFVYDGADVWADLSASNAVVARRLYAGVDHLLSRSVASGANAGAWAYLVDELGSVRDLVNSSGQVQDHLDYTGFGVATESHASVGDRYGYTGRERNKHTQVQHSRGRDYKAGLGRMVQEDPLGLGAGDANVYRYVGNFATGLTDPSGLHPDTFPFGAAWGGGVLDSGWDIGWNLWYKYMPKTTQKADPYFGSVGLGGFDSDQEKILRSQLKAVERAEKQAVAELREYSRSRGTAEVGKRGMGDVGTRLNFWFNAGKTKNVNKNDSVKLAQKVLHHLNSFVEIRRKEGVYFYSGSEDLRKFWDRSATATATSFGPWNDRYTEHGFKAPYAVLWEKQFWRRHPVERDIGATLFHEMTHNYMPVYAWGGHRGTTDWFGLEKDGYISKDEKGRFTIWDPTGLIFPKNKVAVSPETAFLAADTWTGFVMYSDYRFTKEKGVAK